MKKTLVMTVALLTAAGPAFAAGTVQSQEQGRAAIADYLAQSRQEREDHQRSRGDGDARRDRSVERQNGGNRGGQQAGGERGGQQAGGGDRGGRDRGGQQGGGGDRGGRDRGGQQGGGWDRGGQQQGGGDRGGRDRGGQQGGGWDRGGQQQGGGDRGSWGRGDRDGGGWERRDRNRPDWRQRRDRDRDQYRGSWNRDYWRNDFNRRNHDNWWRNNTWFRGYSGLRMNFYFAPGYGYYSVPRQYYGRSYRIGDYLPSVFWRYRANSWSWYGLPAPPPGCAWVYVDNNIYLIDLFDGYIIDVAYQVWRW